MYTYTIQYVYVQTCIKRERERERELYAYITNLHVCCLQFILSFCPITGDETLGFVRFGEIQ